jgi:hypothetical protein
MRSEKYPSEQAFTRIIRGPRETVLLELEWPHNRKIDLP